MENNEYRKFAFSSDKEITRRKFIKDLSLVAGGLTLTSLLGACSSEGTKTVTQNTMTSSTIPTGTTVISTSSTTSSVTTSSTSATSNTTSSFTTTSIMTKPHLFTPPADWNPKTEPIPGCTTSVALDRLYSFDHIWVKQLEGNRVLMGITEKCVLLIGIVDAINQYGLPKVGDRIYKERPFGYMNGKKMNVEFISPVSG